MLWPSIPEHPLFRSTLCHAASRVDGRLTLSTKLNHLPPLTPLPSADTIRSVQIVASAHHSPWRSPPAASLPCVALTALSEFSCVIPTPTTLSVRWSLYQSPQRHRSFKASPLSSRLATGSRRNRFVLLQTGSSPPVAPHAASRRRSYFRLQSHDSL